MPLGRDGRPLPIDPALYDLEPEPLMPRIPGGVAPGPGFDLEPPQFEPERGPIIPYQEPSAGTRFLAPFADMQMGRGAPPLALLLGGLLQGLAQRRVQEHQRGEVERQELNRRYGLAASERNRANLAASGRALTARIAEKKAESARIESDKDARDPRLTIGHALQLGLPPARAGKRISQLSPDEQSRIAPKAGLTGMGQLYGEVDPASIAEAIVAGRASPDLTQYGRPAGAAVASILEKKYRFDARKAGLQYKSDVRFFSTQNQPRLVVLRQTIATTRSHLERLRELNDALTRVIPRGQVPELNRVGIAAAVRGTFGPEAGVIASQMRAQMGLMQSELATVFSNGASPTDEARRLANQMIRDDLGPNQISGNADNIARDLSFKEQAMLEAQPVGPAAPVAPDTGFVLMQRDGKVKRVPRDQVEAMRKLGATEAQ